MKLCTVCNEIVPAGQGCARSDCPNKASTTASPATPKIEPGITGKSDQTVQSGLDKASDAARDATRKIFFLLLVVCTGIVVSFLLVTRHQESNELAEHWVFVVGGERANLYIDPISVEEVGYYKRARERMDTLDPSSEVARDVTLREFDCTGRRGRDLQFTTYYRTGETTGGVIGDDGFDGDWYDLEPESLGMSVLDYVCFGKSPTSSSSTSGTS